MATSGSLHLEVIEARLTRDTSTFTSMDPYVKITYRMQEFKTETNNGKNPEWNEAFDIDVKYVGDDMIIKVLDKCMEGDDDVSTVYFISFLIHATTLIYAQVGEMNIKASSLCSGTGIDDWFPIHYKGKQSGQLHLKSTWAPAGTEDAAQDANETATPMLGDTSRVEMTQLGAGAAVAVQPGMLPQIN